jgi:hypothetical protein
VRSGVNADRRREVLEAPRTYAAQRDIAHAGRGRDRRGGDEELAPPGGGHDARSDVDRGAPPISSSLHRRSRVEAGVDRRQAGLANLLVQAQPEAKHRGGVDAADEHRVSRQLHHLRAVPGRDGGDDRCKPERDIRGRLVAGTLRKRGVADQVREEEGVLLDHHHHGCVTSVGTVFPGG